MARLIQMTHQPVEQHRIEAGLIGLGWLVVVMLMVAVHALLIDAPPLVRMLALVTALFLWCKLLVYHTWQLQTGRTLTGSHRALFFFPWPGMRPDAFLKTHPNLLVAWAAALCYLISGVAVLCGAYTAAHAQVMWLAIPLLLLGLSFTVHFGLLGLIAAGLRGQGYRVRPPFLAPWKSRSLNEFWSQRWNRPFTELLTWTVYRPVATKWTRTHAVWAGFLASGLLHEVAISLPVQSGYGLPTLYFMLQAAGLHLETRWKTNALWKLVGWWLWVLLPLPLVFHVRFIYEVLFPLIGVTLP